METKYINAEKLIAEIKKLKEPYRSYLSDFENGWREGCDNVIDDILRKIDSLQQEAEEEREKKNDEMQKTSIEYRDSVIKHIEAKRKLPSLKGQLLHDFKNELNTMEQILNIKSWPQIQYAIFEKVALVFYDLGLKAINKRGNS